MDPVGFDQPGTSAGVEEFLRSTYGIQGAVRPLAGENRNFLVIEGDERSVLKIAVQGQAETILELEHEIAEHLTAAGLRLRVPRSIPTLDGRSVTTFESDAGPLPARLTQFTQGTPWIEVDELPEGAHRELGRRLGELDRALDGFAHPAAERTHRWDLTAASGLRTYTSAIPDSERRRQIELAFHLFAGCALPVLPELPRSLIHGDVNDENVLVAEGRALGLIDFGDALVNPTICELAIAATYVMLGQGEPLAAAAELVAGYHQSRPLTNDECEILLPLIHGRLASSLTIAADRRRSQPDHSPYFVTEGPAWDLLEALTTLSPETASRELLAAMEGGRVEQDSLSVATLLERRERRIGPSLSLAYSEPLALVRGRAQYLYDRNGRPYLDLVNNVCHVGHCHPRVVAAGREQMGVLNTNTRYLYRGLTEYAERLAATLPSGLDVCYFVNSGSEANELALRLARAHTGYQDILVVEGAYHGHTSTLIEISPYKFLGRGGRGRAEPWVHTVSMPDTYRGRFRGDATAAAAGYVGEVESTLKAAGSVAGFIIEPLLGCGGQVVPPAGFLERAFELVRAAGGVAIADEVQVGFGRVGSHFWAFDAQGARPDIVVLGKPIGNGHPMAAVITTREIADSFANGMEFFSTFGGNPVSCAIGLAVLDVLESEGLQRRAHEFGGLFKAGLEALAERHPVIGTVRGLGLFLGVELVHDQVTREPAADLAATLVDRMRSRGILLATDGPLRNVLKIKPPLVLDRHDIEMTLRCFDEELATLG